MLPLAELALHHDDVIAELTEHCVEAIYIYIYIYFGSPSFHPGHVSSRGMVFMCLCTYICISYNTALWCIWILYA